MSDFSPVEDDGSSEAMLHSVELTDKERLHVRWPDGSRSIEEVTVLLEDRGGIEDGYNPYVAYVTRRTRGAVLMCRLVDSELECKRLRGKR